MTFDLSERLTRLVERQVTSRFVNVPERSASAGRFLQFTMGGLPASANGGTAFQSGSAFVNIPSGATAGSSSKANGAVNYRRPNDTLRPTGSGRQGFTPSIIIEHQSLRSHWRTSRQWHPRAVTYESSTVHMNQDIDPRT